MGSEPVDYSFMRSGIAVSQSLPIEKEVSKQVVSLICALVEKSLYTAMYYTEQAKRKNMTETDFMYALKYETSVFLDDTDTDSRIREFYSMVTEYSDDSDDSDDSDSVVSEEVTESESFVEASDETNEKIRAINEVNRTWGSFQPNDIIKQILKESIDTMIEKIQIEGLGSLCFEIHL